MTQDLDAHLKELDNQIRAGKSEYVRNQLGTLKPHSVPREYAASLAKLARRANLPELALQILHPIVRSKKILQPKASGKEIAEYAAALAFLGASYEAYGLAKKVNPSEVPETLLYQAFALFAQWSYKEAVDPLMTYIHSKNVAPYDRLVGKVNLAAALLSQRIHRDAEEVLNDVIRESKEQGYQLLLGNALQMLAENNIQLGNYHNAEKLLYEAQAAIHDSSSPYELFIRKWRAFLSIKSKGVSEHTLSELHQVRYQAQDRRHWETIRDCDRFEALATGNKKIFLKVYFGTPFKRFRKYLLADFGQKTHLPDFYFWGRLPEGEANEGVMELDLQSASISVRNASGVLSRLNNPLEVGGSLHLLLLALCSDFYCPLSLRVLYATLFPDEFYDPETSDIRIRSFVKELSQWLATANLPIEVIEEERHFFRLAFKGPSAVKVPLQHPLLKR
ncbi:MAG: hypothetical protein HY537_13365 [Deltaproteobacteria bacterium]|nr:hypothetical protein [Deltaproteobacteria bacterium]